MIALGTRATTGVQYNFPSLETAADRTQTTTTMVGYIIIP